MRSWSSFRFCEKLADCYESKIMIYRKREEEGGSAATDLQILFGKGWLLISMMYSPD